MVRRKFKEGTRPALVQGTENAGKCTPSCGCPTALCLSQVSLSRTDYKTAAVEIQPFCRLCVCMISAFAVPFSLNINIIP